MCRRPLGAGRQFLQESDGGRPQARLGRLVRHLRPQSLASLTPADEPSQFPREAGRPHGAVARADLAEPRAEG